IRSRARAGSSAGGPAAQQAITNSVAATAFMPSLASGHGTARPDIGGEVGYARRRLTHPRRRSVSRGGVRLLLFASLGTLGLATGASAADPPPGPCFDFSHQVVEPLIPLIPLVPGHDNHVFGTGPSGVGWASGRVVLDVPVAAVYASLLDHRNLKDMTKTTITTTVVERP